MEIFLKVYVIISYTHKHIYVYVYIRCFKMPLLLIRPTGILMLLLIFSVFYCHCVL